MDYCVAYTNAKLIYRAIIITLHIDTYTAYLIPVIQKNRVAGYFILVTYKIQSQFPQHNGMLQFM